MSEHATVASVTGRDVPVWTPVDAMVGKRLLDVLVSHADNRHRAVKVRTNKTRRMVQVTVPAGAHTDVLNFHRDGTCMVAGMRDAAGVVQVPDEDAMRRVAVGLDWLWCNDPSTPCSESAYVASAREFVTVFGGTFRAGTLAELEAPTRMSREGWVGRVLYPTGPAQS